MKWYALLYISVPRLANPTPCCCRTIESIEVTVVYELKWKHFTIVLLKIQNTKLIGVCGVMKCKKYHWFCLRSGSIYIVSQYPRNYMKTLQLVLSSTLDIKFLSHDHVYTRLITYQQIIVYVEYATQVRHGNLFKNNQSRVTCTIATIMIRYKKVKVILHYKVHMHYISLAFIAT